MPSQLQIFSSYLPSNKDEQETQRHRKDNRFSEKAVMPHLLHVTSLLPRRRQQSCVCAVESGHCQIRYAYLPTDLQRTTCSTTRQTRAGRRLHHHTGGPVVGVRGFT